ncbi:hypothetical protein G6F42_027997 [Rhizopus arrhizus]|nr:hypothetical protein G6F42_027997 [Rhizopus arrhizus]
MRQRTSFYGELPQQQHPISADYSSYDMSGSQPTSGYSRVQTAGYPQTTYSTAITAATTPPPPPTTTTATTTSSATTTTTATNEIQWACTRRSTHSCRFL